MTPNRRFLQHLKNQPQPSNRIIPSNPQKSIPRRTNRGNSRPVCTDESSHRRKSTKKSIGRRQHPVNRIRFHAQPGNPNQGNNSRPGLDRGTVMSRRQKHAGNPRRLQARRRKTYTPLGITKIDDRIIVPKSLRYAALNALHFGYPRVKKMRNDATIFWWPNMRADFEKKAKTYSARLNAGKKLKTQLPITEKSKIDPPKNPGQEIQIAFPGYLNTKHLNSAFFSSCRRQE